MTTEWFCMRTLVAAIVIVGFFGTAHRTMAQMTSPNFEIRWDTVGAGGNDVGTSASYILRDTTGNVGIGGSDSTGYSLGGGYRNGVVDSFIEFSFFAQNNAIVEPATAIVGNTVSCDSSSFGAEDMIAVIQDRGASQVVGVGKVVSVGAGDLTYDVLIGDGTLPVVDGTNDYVYLLEGNSANLGTISASGVSTSVVGMEVTTGSESGYVVQIAADGNLRDGAASIDNVADGSVTAGSEEYGGRSSDVSLAGSTFDSMDTAFSTAFQDIVDRSDSATDERSFLTIKGSINGATTNGNYSQALTLVVSGTF